MNTYFVKIRHIVPTFMLIIIGTTSLVLLFRWVFSINSDILNIKEEVYHLWIPLVLPWIPISIWLRPKLRIIKFKNGDASMAFQLIAYMTMAAVLMVSNEYLKTATGKLLEVKTIYGLEGDNSQYVSIETIILHRNLGSVHTDFRVSGKRNQHLNFDTYFVIPFKYAGDDFTYWYGVKFHKQISNKLSERQTDVAYQEFFKTAVRDFEKYQFSKPDYLEKLGPSKDKDNYIKAIKKLNLSVNEPVILIAAEGEYENRNGNKLFWIFGFFAIGLAIFLILLIFPSYRSSEHKRQLKGIKPKSDDLIDMLKFLIPGGNHFATSIILDLNILIFLIMIFSGANIISPNGRELIQWGANRHLETLNGGWWRLFANIFIHAGIAHLLITMIGLVFSSIYLERVLGWKKYLFIYLLSGLSASIASAFWNDSLICLGASNAVLGLCGAVIVLLFKNYYSGVKALVFLPVALYLIFILLSAFFGNSDNAGSITGLLIGAFIGLLLENLGFLDNEEMSNFSVFFSYTLKY